MSIITISRDVCSKGAIIAQRVAEKLNYECISREILMEASDQFNIPEIKFAKAIHDGPSFLEKFTPVRQKYIALFQAALLNHLKKDNVVYHGLGGQFFLQGIPNVIKIRIITGMDARIKEEANKDNVPEVVAKKILLNDSRNRHNWGLHVYGLDTADNELYDMILHLDNLTIDDCVDLICKTSELESFKSTPRSLARMADLTIAANVKAAIIENYNNVSVVSRDGKVSVHVNDLVGEPKKAQSEIKSSAGDVNGVKSISVHVKSDSIRTLTHNY